MKERAQKTVLIILGLLILGVLYGVFFSITGIGIPCIFYKITGFLCPGCGVTRMCVALMEGNIAMAMQSNPMIFFLTPFILYVIGDQVFWYIKTGTIRNSKWRNVMVYFMIVLLIGYGIFRNL